MIEIIEPTTEQEVRLFVNYVSDDQKKADKVIEYYAWIAEYIAFKYKNLGVEIDELYDAGCDALFEAAADYHLDCGTRFSRFALKYVRDGEYDLIMEEAALKHITSSVSAAMLRAKSTASIISSNLKNDSTDWYVANALGYDENELLDFVFGDPILTKENIQNTTIKTAKSVKKKSESASISFLKKAINRIDEIIEQLDDE